MAFGRRKSHDQPVDEPDRPRMRQAEDSPELVVGLGAIPNDDECGRRFASVVYDVAGSLLDPESGRYRGHVIDVLTLDGDKIAAVTAFLLDDSNAAETFASFGLPADPRHPTS